MRRKRSAATPLLANPFGLWTDLALKTAEMMMASAKVIQHRSARMLAAEVVPSARDRREFTLMGQEKVDAATDSTQAVMAQWAGAGAKMNARAARQMISGTSALLSLMCSRSPRQFVARQAALLRAMNSSAAVTTSQSAARLAQGALKPFHARATANARRLGRR